MKLAEFDRIQNANYISVEGGQNVDEPKRLSVEKARRSLKELADSYTKAILNLGRTSHKPTSKKITEEQIQAFESKWFQMRLKWMLTHEPKQTLHLFQTNIMENY